MVGSQAKVSPEDLQALKKKFADFLAEVERLTNEYDDEIAEILKQIDERKIKELKQQLGVNNN